MPALDQINQGGTIYEIVPEIAELFKTTKAYHTGDHVIYEAGWYTFKADKSAGAWDATKVDGPFKVTKQLSDLKEGFTALESDGVVPSAEQILSDKGVTDSVPYHYRKTGGDGADRLYDQIVGGTVCFNQLAYTSQVNASKTQNGVTITDNRDGTYTVSTDANGATANTYSSLSNANVSFKSGHKYLFCGTPSTGSANTYYSYLAGIVTAYDYSKGVVFTTPTEGSATIVVTYIKQGTVITTPVTFKQQVFDLTQMFGSTIADYIYQLERTTAGAGVAFFKSLFPNDYYEYNTGELVSVSGLSEHKMTGFNQWDEKWENGRFNLTTGKKTSGNGLASKNKINVFANTTYYANCGAGYGSTLLLLYYDANENFISYEVKYSLKTNFTTPTNARYMNFNLQTSSTVTIYNHDICINISDPTKNGTYEPYKAHNYPLDSSLTLRGIPKMSDGKMYFDGDRYLPDGKVERRYGIRTYQSGDESLADAITDGTNTVYKLTTMTIEESTPYRQLQICDPNGTEEFVSTGIVPVGHETRYPENLRAKIDGLPWDFSSLIAPTEKSTTASRNYTTGSLLIMGNVLYKVTANIANGGTITPNTNVTATTLSEILSAMAQ